MNQELQALEKAVKEASKSRAVYYVTLDPEKSLGVEDILIKYRVITLYDSDVCRELENKNIQILVLERELPESELLLIEKAGSYGIVKHPRTKLWIEESSFQSKPYIVTLKNTDSLLEVVDTYEWSLLGPKPSIASEFEEKLSQFQHLKDRVRFPSVIISELGAYQTKSKFPLVIQFNRGHSGNSTFRIDNESQYQELLKSFPKRQAKIVEYIKGDTYTLNGLVLKDGRVLHGSISLQITGLPEATNNPNATVGNDFGLASQKLNEKQKADIKEMLESVGRTMSRLGYCGMFGIDVVMSEENDEVFFIEVNTHQPASISFESVLHRNENSLSVLLAFYADAFDVKVSDSLINAMPITLRSDARQVIFRNKTLSVLKREDVVVPKIEEKAEVKLIGVRTKTVRPNQEMYRIQSFS